MRIDRTCLNTPSRKPLPPQSAFGAAVATLAVSAALIASPSPASALDLNGLVQGAIAHYVAGGRLPNPGYGGGHSTRVHVATHRSRHDDDNDDAAPGSTNTPPPQPIGTSPHLASGGGRTAPQSTDNVRMVSTAGSEELSFSPSR